tara:strand:- start:29933 stop:30064 length:132 start_codon:yes stop_codon:yes gene_type:complete
MDESTVTVTIKGKPYYFNGDEITSPEQEAILFLMEIDKEQRAF